MTTKKLALALLLFGSTAVSLEAKAKTMWDCIAGDCTRQDYYEIEKEKKEQFLNNGGTELEYYKNSLKSFIQNIHRDNLKYYGAIIPKNEIYGVEDSIFSRKQLIQAFKEIIIIDPEFKNLINQFEREVNSLDYKVKRSKENYNLFQLNPLF
jgi:hypothetical protein